MLILVRRILWIAAVAALLGAIYSQLNYGIWAPGALIGAVNGTALPLLEFAFLRGGPGTLLNQAPFAVFLAVRIAAYAFVIFFVFAIARLTLGGPFGATRFTVADGAFSLAMCVMFNLLVAVDDLLGQGVMFAFIAGRYHRPRREERALLFIDMRGSTAAAERLGEERFLDLLNAFYAEVTQAVVAYGGRIHKYVGDEAIATWPLRAGLAPRCAEVCFAAADRLAARAAEFRQDFGQELDFRAALHCGVVVIGELGFTQREIALIGDAMNTTSRMVDACRQAGVRVLASADALHRLAPLPSTVEATEIEPITLRGKAAPLALFALQRKS